MIIDTRNFRIERLRFGNFGAAFKIVGGVWGDDFAKRFLNEMSYSLIGNSGVLLGVCKDDQLCGVASISKDLIDYDFWSLTWVTVDPQFRNQGIGKMLVQAAEEYVQEDIKNYPVNCPLVQLTASIPQYYYKLGYLTATVLPSGRFLMYKEIKVPEPSRAAEVPACLSSAADKGSDSSQ